MNPEKHKSIIDDLRVTERALSDPNIFADTKKLTELNRHRIYLNHLLTIFDSLEKTEKELAEAENIIETVDDPGLIALAQEEAKVKRNERESLAEQIQFELLPRDEKDSKNIIIEIRAGAGGDEAALFAAELFRMYINYAEHRDWKVEILTSHQNEIGGFKEVIFEVMGEDAGNT